MNDLQRSPGPRLSWWRDSGRNTTIQRRIDGGRGGLGTVLNAGSYDADPARGVYSDRPDPRPPFSEQAAVEQEVQEAQAARQRPIFAGSLGWSRSKHGYAGKPDGAGDADPLLGDPLLGDVTTDLRTGAAAVSACDMYGDDPALSLVRSASEALPSRRFGESATALNTDLLSGKVSVAGRLGGKHWPADYASELGDGWPLRFSRQNAPFGPGSAAGQRYEDTRALVRECVELVGASPAAASRVEYGTHGAAAGPPPGAYILVQDSDHERAKAEAEAAAAAERIRFSQERKERGRKITAAAMRKSQACFKASSQERSKSRQRAARRAKSGGARACPDAPRTWDSSAKSLLPSGEFAPNDYSKIEPPAMVADATGRFDALWTARMESSLYWPVMPEALATGAAAAIMRRRQRRQRGAGI